MGDWKVEPYPQQLVLILDAVEALFQVQAPRASRSPFEHDRPVAHGKLHASSNEKTPFAGDSPSFHVLSIGVTVDPWPFFELKS